MYTIENQCHDKLTKEIKISDSQTVLVVTNGEGVFRKYGDIEHKDQVRVNEAIKIVQRHVKETKDADPSGDLAVEPFQDEWWCKIDIIDGALGVGCGIFGYWCSVWIHPDKGVVAQCGS